MTPELSEPRVYYITSACLTQGIRMVMARPPRLSNGRIYPYGGYGTSYQVGRTAHETWQQAVTAAKDEVVKREATIRAELGKLRRLRFNRPDQFTTTQPDK